jgi:hypothetical protein
MKKIGLLFSLLLCCTLTFSQSNFLDAGSGVPADEPQGQPVLSFSFSGTNAITVTLVTGVMTPELMLAAASGTGFAKMEIKVYDDQNNKVTYKITMLNVFVTSIQAGTGLFDYVTLRFNKFRIKESSH